MQDFPECGRNGGSHSEPTHPGTARHPSGEGCPQGGVCRSTDCPMGRLWSPTGPAERWPGTRQPVEPHRPDRQILTADGADTADNKPRPRMNGQPRSAGRTSAGAFGLGRSRT